NVNPVNPEHLDTILRIRQSSASPVSEASRRRIGAVVPNGGSMKRLLVLAGTACLMTSVLPSGISAQNSPSSPSASGPKAASKAWTPRRLSDGQPDIQGVWTNYDSTPFQTPSPEDDKALAALREWFPPGDQTGPGSVWENDGSVGQRKNPRRKAMVVQPENGRVPVRPEAVAKKD